MNIEDLKDQLHENGIGKYFELLRPHLRNTIRLYQKSVDENQITIGQTKIGGKPDLPKEITWITETNIIESIHRKFLIFNTKEEKKITKPLSFIAQINLSETAAFDSDDLLPKKGILFFFYSADQDVWGFDHKDRNKFKVVYWNGNFTNLKRTDFPKNLPEYARYKTCSVSIKQEITLPSFGHKVFENFEEQELDIFGKEIYKDEEINKLLGYSDNIQNEMELECELVTNGLYCGDQSGYNDPKAKELEPNSKNWRLLLQIDSNEENEMMWGDSGRLYFWIKKEDLLNLNFDESWLCLQCS